VSDLDYFHKKLSDLVREAEDNGMKFWIDRGVYEFLLTDSRQAQIDKDYDKSRVIW